MGPWEYEKLPKEGGLFDLSSDLHEDKNVANEHPEVMATMKKIIEDIRKKPDK